MKTRAAVAWQPILHYMGTSTFSNHIVVAGESIRSVVLS